MSEEPIGAGNAPRLMTVQELALYLNVSTGWVRKGVLSRTLPYTKLGKNVRFTPDQVAQILAAGDVPPAAGSGGSPRRDSRRTRL